MLNDKLTNVYWPYHSPTGKLDIINIQPVNEKSSPSLCMHVYLHFIAFLLAVVVKRPSQVDVAPWCYKLGWDGNLWLGWSIEHLTVLNRLSWNLSRPKGSPCQKKPCIFGHYPNCDLTPPKAQIRALCGTIFLPKMRKFFKQQFWL